jgi:hypothetical protein
VLSGEFNGGADGFVCLARLRAPFLQPQHPFPANFRISISFSIAFFPSRAGLLASLSELPRKRLKTEPAPVFFVKL